MFHCFVLWFLNAVPSATVDLSGYGFRTLLEKKCADVLQSDVSVQYFDLAIFDILSLFVFSPRSSFLCETYFFPFRLRGVEA